MSLTYCEEKKNSLKSSRKYESKRFFLWGQYFSKEGGAIAAQTLKAGLLCGRLHADVTPEDLTLTFKDVTFSFCNSSSSTGLPLFGMALEKEV